MKVSIPRLSSIKMKNGLLTGNVWTHPNFGRADSSVDCVFAEAYNIGFSDVVIIGIDPEGEYKILSSSGDDRITHFRLASCAALLLAE